MKIFFNKTINLCIYFLFLTSIIYCQKMNTQVLKDKTIQGILSSKKAKTDSTLKNHTFIDIGNKVFGIINLSVASLRSKPGHAEELTTQSLLGTLVKIHNKHNNWYYVQTPDDYLAWIEADAIQLMDKDEYNIWLKSNKIIFISPFGFSYSKPNLNSQTISDLVIGDIVKFLELRDNFFKVEYPDKRTAFIPVKDCEYFQKWINNIKINSQSIIRTAETFLGIPYLWGGTSIKGVDCSGFTKMVFFLNGILLPRDASQQAETGEFITNKVDTSKLKPGDLLFFGEKEGIDGKEKVSHVGIYIGEGEFIHSAGYVRKNNLLKGKPDFQQQRLDKYLFARRILTSLNKNGIYLLKDYNVYYKEN